MRVLRVVEKEDPAGGDVRFVGTVLGDEMEVHGGKRFELDSIGAVVAWVEDQFTTRTAKETEAAAKVRADGLAAPTDAQVAASKKSPEQASAEAEAMRTAATASTLRPATTAPTGAAVVVDSAPLTKAEARAEAKAEAKADAYGEKMAAKK